MTSRSAPVLGKLPTGWDPGNKFCGRGWQTERRHTWRREKRSEMKIPVNAEEEVSQVINLFNISKFNWAAEEEAQGGGIGNVKWQLLIRTNYDLQSKIKIPSNFFGLILIGYDDDSATDYEVSDSSTNSYSVHPANLTHSPTVCNYSRWNVSVTRTWTWRLPIVTALLLLCMFIWCINPFGGTSLTVVWTTDPTKDHKEPFFETKAWLCAHFKRGALVVVVAVIVLVMRWRELAEISHNVIVVWWISRCGQSVDGQEPHSIQSNRWSCCCRVHVFFVTGAASAAAANMPIIIDENYAWNCNNAKALADERFY